MDTATAQSVAIIAFLSLGIAVFALMAAIALAVYQSRLLKRYRMILSGTTGRDLESLLLSHGAAIEGLDSRLSQVAAQLTSLEAATKAHVQRTATVRFSAFPDTGSDLSFAIALLDANNNGLVLSSLYGRTESRVYAKPVHGGTSTYSLSEEEQEAIAKAVQGANRVQ